MSAAPHCVPEELLLAYAAGNVPEAVALVVATHLALCPVCRAAVADLEVVGGAMFARVAGASVDDALLDRTLSRLDEPEPPRPARPLSAPELAFLPEPLRSYVPHPIPWRRKLPSVWTVDLGVGWGDEPARLTRLRPGSRIDTHGHTGTELHVVLTGGYGDKDQHFGRGDFQVADETVEHALDIDRGEDCITLLVKSGRLVPKTWAGWLYSKLADV